MKRIALALAMIALAITPAFAQEAKQLRIVKQPGLGYLQLIVMREQKLIEKRAPGVEIEWRQLTSGPVIRDAMVAGQMDIGSGGLGPFIQAIDRGLDWKTLGGLNEMPLFLNCARADIKSLKDLKPTDRIAMPAIGSAQHVILQMQAEKELGDPKKLNQQIVAMALPTAPPRSCPSARSRATSRRRRSRYEQLRDPGIKKIFDSFQAVGGPHTFKPRLGEREVGEGESEARQGLRRRAEGSDRLREREARGGRQALRDDREIEVDARGAAAGHQGRRDQVHHDARRTPEVRHLHAEDRHDQDRARAGGTTPSTISTGCPATVASGASGRVLSVSGRHHRLSDGARGLHRGRARDVLGEARREVRPARPVGLRQVDAAQVHRGLRGDGGGGEFELEGRAVVRATGPDRVVVFQEFDQLLPWKTVRGNIVYPLRVARGLSEAAAREAAHRFIAIVGLDGFADTYPHQLSGGMKQRVAIARSLALDPAMLLMDEPFASLDALTRRKMQDELLGIWETTHKTLLFVTHSIQEAVLLGDRILILSKGPGRVRRIVDNRAVGQRETAGSLDAQREIQEILDV